MELSYKLYIFIYEKENCQATQEEIFAEFPELNNSKNELERRFLSPRYSYCVTENDTIYYGLKMRGRAFVKELKRVWESKNL